MVFRVACACVLAVKAEANNSIVMLLHTVCLSPVAAIAAPAIVAIVMLTALVVIAIVVDIAVLIFVL